MSQTIFNADDYQYLVCSYYQLFKNGNKFVVDVKKADKIQGNKPITHYSYNTINANSSENGKMYVLDEKATIEHAEYLKQSKETRKQQAELKRVGSQKLADVILGTNTVAPTTNDKKAAREAQIADLNLEAHGIEFKKTSYSMSDANWNNFISALEIQIEESKAKV